MGKGSHTLHIVRQLMSDVPIIEQYQYPGLQQAIMYCCNITKLPQYSPSHPHFFWDDVQLGKGSFSKDRMVKFLIGGKCGVN